MAKYLSRRKHMNKTFIALAAAAMLGMSGAAMAGCDCDGKHADRGGYKGGSSNQITTVKEALSMPDDSTVTMKGQISKQLKKDKYLFSDNTGAVKVEIDKRVWRGQTVTANDVVEISGDIDRDDDSILIDVDRLVLQGKNRD